MNKVPLSLALLTLFAGLTITYWALVGFGVIQGGTPAERAKNIKETIRG